jgi:hydroxymethylglutaryl-CoA synthase
MRVAGVGAYVPRFRLSTEAVQDALGQFHARGVEQVAVPDADEDALTMAAEAGERALDAAGLDPGEVDVLYLASTTLPYEEEAGTGRLQSLLGLGESTESAQFGGSTDAGGAALAAGLERDYPTLVVASDAVRGADDEALGHAAGAGAAALVLDTDGPGRVAGRGSETTTYPGTRFRERGSTETTGLGVTSYDRQAFRETLAGAVEGLDVDGVDAAALQAPDGDLPYRAAEELGLDAETVAAGSVVEGVGDVGAASALLGLADALRDGAEAVLLATYGSGAASHAFRLVCESDVPVRATLRGDRELSFAGARRRRGDFDSGTPEGGGAYVSVPSYRRTLAARHRLVAGRCRECGSLRFPPEGACRECGSTAEFEDAPLRLRGVVETITTISQGGAPPEFVPQQARSGEYASAIVAFEAEGGGGWGGGEDDEVSVPVQVVLTGEDAPGIGDEVVAVPRVLYDQEGVRRYGAKGIPVDSRRRR